MKTIVRGMGLPEGAFALSSEERGWLRISAVHVFEARRAELWLRPKPGEFDTRIMAQPVPEGNLPLPEAII
jgi:hypothetical protein